MRVLAYRWEHICKHASEAADAEGNGPTRAGPAWLRKLGGKMIQEITMKSTLREVYAHPVGRDVLKKILLQAGISRYE